MNIRETITVTTRDIPFLLGKGGRTKDKLMRVSGARIEVPETDGKIDLFGSPAAIKRCKLYISCLVSQRSGPVELSKEQREENDSTILSIPTDYVQTITGQQGSSMRHIEEDHCTLIFLLGFSYGNSNEHSDDNDLSQLVIFGKKKARRGTELQLLSLIERHLPGYVTSDITAKNDDTETVRQLSQSHQVRILLSRKAIIKKRIAAATDCLVDIIGNWVHIVGDSSNRKIAENYIGYSINGFKDKQQGYATTRSREDCLAISLPVFCLPLIDQETKDLVEATANVVIFQAESKSFTGLLILSSSLQNRMHAELMIMSSIEKHYPGHYSDHLLDRKSDDLSVEIDTLRLSSSELNIFTKQQPQSLNGISSASCCVVQLVGDVLHFLGDYERRRRGRLYAKFLLEKYLNKPVDVRESCINKDVLIYSPHASVVKVIREDSTRGDVLIESPYGFALLSTSPDGTLAVLVCASEVKTRAMVKKVADHHFSSLVVASRQFSQKVGSGIPVKSNLNGGGKKGKK